MALDVVASLGSTYWAAIAQIVPVLAIPLVLEARLIARRLTETEQTFDQRAKRAGWGLLFTTLGISMLVVEVLALAAIPFGSVPAVTFWLSIAVILLALFTVFAIPLAAIASSFLTDIAWLLRARLPWGSLKRNRRQLRQLLDRFETQLRESRGQQLRLAMGRADAELMAAHMRAIMSNSIPASMSENPALRRTWHEALEGAVGSIPEPLELRVQYAAIAENIDEAVMVGEFAIEQTRTLLAGVDSLMRTGASRAQIDDLRTRTASLADAGIGALG